MKKVLICFFVISFFSCTNYVKLDSVVDLKAIESSNVSISEFYSNLEYLFISEGIDFKRVNKVIKISSKDAKNIKKIEDLYKLANKKIDRKGVLNPSITGFHTFGDYNEP